MSSPLNPFASATNPFIRSGVDDPKVSDSPFMVEVGLLRTAKALLFDSSGNPTVRHVLLIAEFGGGKSATLKHLGTLMNSKSRPFVHLNLEENSYKQALATADPVRTFCSLVFERAAQIIIQRTMAIVKARDAIVESVKSLVDREADVFFQDTTGIELSHLLFELGKWVEVKRIAPSMILLDEFEAILTLDSCPNNTKIAILDVFKRWCDTTTRGVSLVIAGTQACLDYIRFHFTKLTAGRLEVCDNYTLEEWEMKFYIDSKCRQSCGRNVQLFEGDAIKLISLICQGIPRRLEIVCHLAWNEAAGSKPPVGMEFVRSFIRQKTYGQVRQLASGYVLTELQKQSFLKLFQLGGSNFKNGDIALHPRERRCLNRMVDKSFKANDGSGNCRVIVARRERGPMSIPDDLLVLLFVKL